jgi:hypothetical protein
MLTCQRSTSNGRLKHTSKQALSQQMLQRHPRWQQQLPRHLVVLRPPLLMLALPSKQQQLLLMLANKQPTRCRWMKQQQVKQQQQQQAKQRSRSRSS